MIMEPIHAPAATPRHKRRSWQSRRPSPSPARSLENRDLAAFPPWRMALKDEMLRHGLFLIASGHSDNLRDDPERRHRRQAGDAPRITIGCTVDDADHEQAKASRPPTSDTLACQA